MGLPQLTINLRNGGLGRVAQTDDGVAGLILTGTAVAGKLDLNKVYALASVRDLTSYGITEENNPLVYKDVSRFYAKAGDGAELYLLVVAQATTLTQMCSSADASPIRKLITFGKGRIRLVGINRLPAEGYNPETETHGIDADVVTALAAMQEIGQNYASQIKPFRALIPALYWNEQAETLYKPVEGSYNRVQVVMAADRKYGSFVSASIGEALGVYASIPVHQSSARVKNGAVNAEGMLTNGKSIEDNEAYLNMLHDAGYLIYRTFVSRNGYYYNDDPTAAPLTDDYSSMAYGRVIDKATIILYTAFISEINENIEVDEDGYIPISYCKSYEGTLDNAVAVGMKGEISSFSAYVDPKQNILSSSKMDVNCSIVPKGILRNININLGFENPALNQ